uniref:Uncharacterized protein n=1 Tax=Arundo donax TaxID=35708 RepID=A0A0A9FNC1_ARUDO
MLRSFKLLYSVMGWYAMLQSVIKPYTFDVIKPDTVKLLAYLLVHPSASNQRMVDICSSVS